MTYVRLSTLAEWRGGRLPCPPELREACGAEITLPRQRVERMSAGELRRFDLARAHPFRVPHGRKKPVNRRFEHSGGEVREVFDTEAITKEDLIARAKMLRRNREIEGITISGIAVATDESSQTKIIGARLAAEADPGWTTPWHAADGSIHQLDAAGMIALADAVQAHIKATFVKLEAVRADVERGRIATYDEVDRAFE